MKGGYSIPTLRELNREVSCGKESISITDVYEFDCMPESIVERFVSLKPFELTDEGIKCGDSVLLYDKEVFDVSFTSEGLMRHGHREETVYIADLTVKAPAKEMKLSFEIK